MSALAFSSDTLRFDTVELLEGHAHGVGAGRSIHAQDVHLHPSKLGGARGERATSSSAAAVRKSRFIVSVPFL